jgi:glycosyltransferase involved in cell wall biosynthesis
VLVVDNHSSDGSRAWLDRQPDVKVIALPANVGHGLALDIGFLNVRTEFAVALDTDAFPFREAWLDTVLDPLRGDFIASGGDTLGYAHPSFFAMRTRAFVERRHSFVAHVDPDSGDLKWDVGQRISVRERDRCHRVPTTEVRGPGPLGTVYGGVVYHNFYSVRHLRLPSDDDVKLDGLVDRTDARTAWNEAVARYLPGS